MHLLWGEFPIQTPRLHNNPKVDEYTPKRTPGDDPRAVNGL
jgi:hypothetical protein